MWATSCPFSPASLLVASLLVDIALFPSINSLKRRYFYGIYCFFIFMILVAWQEVAFRHSISHPDRVTDIYLIDNDNHKV